MRHSQIIDGTNRIHTSLWWGHNVQPDSRTNHAVPQLLLQGNVGRYGYGGEVVPPRKIPLACFVQSREKVRVGLLWAEYCVLESRNEVLPGIFPIANLLTSLVIQRRLSLAGSDAAPVATVQACWRMASTVIEAGSENCTIL